MAFELTPKQAALRDLCASPAENILAYGGSRSGKTFGFLYCIAARGLMAPESRHLVCRRHNVDVRRAVLMDTWPKMMRLAHPGVPYDLNKTDGYATLPGGSEVWFSGLDDAERVDKILGMEFATIFTNESSQVPYDTITTLRTRLAQNVKKRNGRQLELKTYQDLNPNGKSHWTYQEFILNTVPKSGEILPADQFRHIVLNPQENPHLSAAYLAILARLPARKRQRFLDGRYVTEVAGAIWSQDVIDTLRMGLIPPLRRIVVAVDPAVTSGDNADDSGIVVAGLGMDDHGYILDDRSLKGTPDEVCREAVAAYRAWGADRIVAEVNNGGDWIEALLRTADPNISYRAVRASRGKVVRAEPSSSLYEQGLIHHVGTFADLEDQMCEFTTDFDRKAAGYSPDRVDALVWALTDLFGSAGMSFGTL
jgi:phage terminase large subunit-like protein